MGCHVSKSDSDSATRVPEAKLIVSFILVCNSFGLYDLYGLRYSLFGLFEEQLLSDSYIHLPQKRGPKNLGFLMFFNLSFLSGNGFSGESIKTNRHVNYMDRDV